MPTSTKQINLLEQAWRDSKPASSSRAGGGTGNGAKKRSPSTKTPKRQPTTSSNETKKKSRSKPSRPKKKQATQQAIKPKAKKRGRTKSKASLGRSYKVKQSKPAPAKNISKLGGGLKAKLAPAMSVLKAKAVQTGISKQGLKTAVGRFGGKKLASLGLGAKAATFLAPIGTIPGIGLAVAAETIWSDNIKKIKQLYDVRPIQPTLLFPPEKPFIQRKPTPFKGGQVSGKSYDAYLTFNVRPKNNDGEGDPRTYGFFFNRVGKITSLSYFGFSNYVSAKIIYADGEQEDSDRLNVGVFSELVPNSGVWTVEPTNGDAEPEDNASSFEKTTPKRIYRVRPIRSFENQETLPKPPKGSNSKFSIDSLGNIPVVTTLPFVLPLPTRQAKKDSELQSKGATSTVPTTPVEVGKIPSTSPKKKKPSKPSTKTTRYPTEQEAQKIKQAIKQSNDRLPTKIDSKTPTVRSIPKDIYEAQKKQEEENNKANNQNKTSTEDAVDVNGKTAQPVIPTVETEEETKLPIPPIPGRVINKPGTRVETANPKTPTATKLNPCKKGCAGGSGGTATETIGSNPAFLGLANDVLIQNDLLKKIDRTTTATNNAVFNPNFGLAKIFNFVETAWKTTGADKAIGALTLFTSLHNAAMLGQNAAVSLGDTVSAGANFFNIKGFDGEPLDVNAGISKNVKALLISIFGEANLNAASETWKKLNRIHQATASVVNSIQGTKNALLEADEITGGNVAKLANTFLLEGQIQDDAFELMNERPDYQTQFAGILGKINAIDEISDRVSSIVSSGLEIKENVNELKTNSEDLKKATDEFVDKKKTEEQDKDTASVSPDIDRLDLLKQEPDTN